MRLLNDLTCAVFVALTIGGAALADVTVSHANDPAAALDAQMAALLGKEHATLNALPPAQLASLATGPKALARQSGLLRNRKAAAAVNPVDAVWLAAQPAPKGDAQWQCLTQALYFEARGETLKGQVAVAEVIMNRVDSPAYPKSVCAVVGQGSRAGCQFSFKCDRNSDTMRDRAAIDLAGRIARAMLDGAPRRLTSGATHFHTRAVRPGWAHRFPKTAVIGAHLFYRQPARKGV